MWISVFVLVQITEVVWKQWRRSELCETVYIPLLDFNLIKFSRRPNTVSSLFLYDSVSNSDLYFVMFPRRDWRFVIWKFLCVFC